MKTILAPGIFCGPKVYPHYVGQHGVKMLEQSVSDSFDDRVENLKAVVKKHPEIELVGHSAGCAVIARVAHDVRVNGVTFVSPITMPGQMLPLNVNLALLHYLRFRHCKVIERHATKYFLNESSMDNIVHFVDESWKVMWKLAWHQVARHRRSEFIPMPDTPIRVFGGDKDCATPYRCVKRTAEILGVAAKPLLGYAHMPFLEDKHFADKFHLRPRTVAHA